MRQKLFLSALLVCTLLASAAQTPDSLLLLNIDEVSVVTNAQLEQQRVSPLSINVVDKTDIAERFSGNLMKSLEYLPGVQSMSVGSGFSKPMIRGMAFNRVSVVEGGVKQEGQQWGADHGLEIDAFNIERVNIRKGSSSLLYGSDAMGGVVDILEPVVPLENGVVGSVDMLARSVNDLIGGSVMLGVKHERWFVRVRHSEQYFADFAVPSDTVVYLTQKMPLTDGRVNNTAGFERSTSLYTRYGSGRFSSAVSVSNAYQKAGFYPGAHGIPDPSRVYDDGDLRDIDLPYSTVNHFKVSSLNRYTWDDKWASWDIAYQKNHREEWSEFHTHYSGQEAPEVDPDKEIVLSLQNYSSNFKFNVKHSYSTESTFSWDLAYQDNRIGGYSFLLPDYHRTTTGAAWVTSIEAAEDLILSAGVRYDFGHIVTAEYTDEYLAEYLSNAGYSQAVVEQNKVRSYELDRNFGDYSLSAGGVWTIDSQSTLRFNLGRSFRLPTANELVSNGVHHSSFRHEQGDPTLDSERGWQADMSYEFSSRVVGLSISPYMSWYASYIYQQPTGEWSILPHAGQIYRFMQSQAVFAGGEVALTVSLPLGFSYDMSFEYTHTYNVDERIPLSFSPPTTMRNILSWSSPAVELSAEWHFVADQNRVARNEDPTPGANLFNFSAILPLSFISDGATAVLSVDNIFDTKYLNHLSYYRQIEIPEPGRNFQISIKIPFKL